MTYVSLVEQGVFDYPPGLEGWRFYRVEYWREDADYDFKEESIWLPPYYDATALEDSINESKV